MSTTHVSWGSIELLHNAVRTLTHLNEQGQPFPTVEYRAKIKLHGTNCAVQITDAGPVAQSRNLILTPEADHKGFAKWAASRADYWSTVATGLVVFGEWCGPGVEKGMAISQAKTKLFCVFAIREGDRMIVEPSELEALLPARPDDVHVLPWEGEPVTIDFGSRADLERVAKHLNDRVAEVEAEDPWCKR
ncbi:MAG: RNA ligase family protein, partial [Kofleriaceae bacterium]